MNRRDFLRIGAAGTLGQMTTARMASPLAFGSAGAAPVAPVAPVTVLYDDRSVALSVTGKDPAGATGALWVRSTDLPGINGFELKPQGACRADVCIPLPKEMTRGAYFNLTAFAKRIGQAVVA